MKIAVTARSGELDSEIDPRFGRAAYFVVVETDTFDFDVVDNREAAEGLQGAGIQAAKVLSDTGARVLLTGNCGPRAFSTLAAAGVKVAVGVSGTVRRAVEDYKDGKYPVAEGPNVEPHW